MIDQAWFEAITEHSHQLIHDYIPTLAFGPAISEVADIQKQDLDHRLVVGVFGVNYFSALTTIIFPVASRGLLPEGTDNQAGCFLSF